MRGEYGARVCEGNTERACARGIRSARIPGNTERAYTGGIRSARIMKVGRKVMILNFKKTLFCAIVSS